MRNVYITHWLRFCFCDVPSLLLFLAENIIEKGLFVNDKSCFKTGFHLFFQILMTLFLFGESQLVKLSLHVLNQHLILWWVLRYNNSFYCIMCWKWLNLTPQRFDAPKIQRCSKDHFSVYYCFGLFCTITPCQFPFLGLLSIPAFQKPRKLLVFIQVVVKIQSVLVTH